jgi:hypothetical protein
MRVALLSVNRQCPRRFPDFDRDGLLRSWPKPQYSSDPTVLDVGPIPKGTWTIRPPHTSAQTGPRLDMPHARAWHQHFGPSAFLIHDDDVQHDASHGCAILDHDTCVLAPWTRTRGSDHHTRRTSSDKRVMVSTTGPSRYSVSFRGACVGRLFQQRSEPYDQRNSDVCKPKYRVRSSVFMTWPWVRVKIVCPFEDAFCLKSEKGCPIIGIDLT